MVSRIYVFIRGGHLRVVVRPDPAGGRGVNNIVNASGFGGGGGPMIHPRAPSIVRVARMGFYVQYKTQYENPTDDDGGGGGVGFRQLRNLRKRDNDAALEEIYTRYYRRGHRSSRTRSRRAVRFVYRVFSATVSMSVREYTPKSVGFRRIKRGEGSVSSDSNFFLNC